MLLSRENILAAEAIPFTPRSGLREIAAKGYIKATVSIHADPLT